MKYKIIFHSEAKKELDALDGRSGLIVLKQIKKIMVNPELGELIGNKAGFDLSGYRKMYANRKKIRIVYKITDEKLIIYIISIGKRDIGIVYEEAFKRIVK